MLQIKFNVHIYKSCTDDAITIVGPTNIRRYKGWTVQTLNLQTSDWYKHRTGTNVGLVQTSDQYKRCLGTFIRKNVGLWLSLKKYHCYKKQIKNHSLFVMKIKDNWTKSHPLKVALYKTTDNKGFEFNCHKLWCFKIHISLQPNIV